MGGGSWRHGHEDQLMETSRNNAFIRFETVDSMPSKLSQIMLHLIKYSKIEHTLQQKWRQSGQEGHFHF